MEAHLAAPSKTIFLKHNSFTFLENERYHSELVDARNPSQDATRGQKEEKTTVTINETTHDARETATETVILKQETINFDGPSPKKYISKCYFHPFVIPYWYSETLLLKVGSTKRSFNEKVYFKGTFLPVHWSETMLTDVLPNSKYVYTEDTCPINDFEPNVHYMSLEPQQAVTKVTAL